MDQSITKRYDFIVVGASAGILFLFFAQTIFGFWTIKKKMKASEHISSHTAIFLKVSESF